ncbi:MAG: uroporphyrinogen decarboxylase [Verrucomicrobiota bacterium]|nr:uroporphyrinogen decarboxylase [Verrucomicrobiota bacterium]
MMLFLEALAGKNRGRPPVWFMRQAGRYLPAYQRLRKEHPLLDLFLTPELAAAITAMPVEELGVDAAVLFSDITLPALALGFSLHFSEGPKLFPLLTPTEPFSLREERERLRPVFSAVRAAKERLKVPLIGFCGGPFTLATFLIAGGEEGTREWIASSPGTFVSLLDSIADISLFFLQEQVRAGVDAFQIFDTSAYLLSKEEFRRFALPYYKRLLDGVSAPALLFAKGLHHHLPDLLSLRCGLSLDATASLTDIRKMTAQTLQGNLDPDLLFAPLETIQRSAQALLRSMQGDSAFIAGLGHGIKPGTPLEAVRTLTRALQEPLDEAHD